MHTFRHLLTTKVESYPLSFCLVAGIVFTLGFAPFTLWMVGCLSIPLLLHIVTQTNTLKGAFKRGLLFGIGHYMTSLTWIANALLVDSEQFGWLIPFALLGFSVVPALGIALVTSLSYFFRHSACKMVGVFLLAFMLVEYIRSYFIFTGFPWNLVGYVFADHVIAQLATFTGVHGLSLIALTIFSFTYLFFQPALSRKARYSIGIVMVIGVITSSLYGLHRLNEAPASSPNNAQKVAIIQGNIPQTLKWDPKLRYEHFKTHVTLTKNVAKEDGFIIIWPESAVSFALNRLPELIDEIKAILPPHSVLFTGAIKQIGDEFPELQLFVSLYSIGAQGILYVYDKQILVPFGEYIPLRTYLPLTKITHGTVDYSAGEGFSTMTTLSSIPPVHSSICFEAIFPVPRLRAHHPAIGWLLNVTNDGWFGKSSGPYQHLSMARIRAIEQGLPLLRAANTGISAIIDGYGRVLHILPLDTQGVLQGYLPVPLPPTYYSQHGGTLSVLLLALLIGGILVLLHKRG